MQMRTGHTKKNWTYKEEMDIQRRTGHAKENWTYKGELDIQRRTRQHLVRGRNQMFGA